MKLRAAAAPATPGSGETETQSPLEGTLRSGQVWSLVMPAALSALTGAGCGHSGEWSNIQSVQFLLSEET